MWEARLTLRVDSAGRALPQRTFPSKSGLSSWPVWANMWNRGCRPLPVIQGVSPNLLKADARKHPKAASRWRALPSVKLTRLSGQVEMEILIHHRPTPQIKLVKDIEWKNAGAVSSCTRHQAAGSNTHRAAPPAIGQRRSVRDCTEALHSHSFATAVKIQTDRPCHGCQRERTTRDSVIWVLSCRPVQYQAKTFVTWKRVTGSIQAALARQSDPPGRGSSAVSRFSRFRGVRR